jgi:hypothetical protein
MTRWKVEAGLISGFELPRHPIRRSEERWESVWLIGDKRNRGTAYRIEGSDMTSRVRVNMFPCENKSVIEVQSMEDGNYVVKTTSTCKKAEKFVEGLGPLSLTDLTDKKESKIFRDFISSDMSANCLVLSGVLTAAWVEAGMIARSMTRKGVPLSIEFVEV